MVSSHKKASALVERGRLGARAGLNRSLIFPDVHEAVRSLFADRVVFEDLFGGFEEFFSVKDQGLLAAVEEAGLALEMLIEVRNRFVEAYRTVVNMQT